MVNRSKQLGTGWESACVSWCHDHADMFPELQHAERRALRGNLDVGDLILPAPLRLMVECKNEKAIHLSQYADEVKVQTVNDNAEVGFAWIKRRGKGVSESYILTDPMTMLKLIYR